MTLRTRIAAVASVSVALAVLAAAIGLYAAVRSDLRGEVDSALRARAQAFVAPRPRAGGARPGLGPGRIPAAARRPRAAARAGTAVRAASPAASNRRRSGRRPAMCSSSRRRGRCTCPAVRAPRRGRSR